MRKTQRDMYINNITAADIEKLFYRYTSWNLRNKAVLLRADLNVPLTTRGNRITIGNDFRLRALLPTVQHLRKRGALVFIMTHMGKPTGPENALSTHHLCAWFSQHGCDITFCPTIDSALKAQKANRSGIFLLENLRFNPYERREENSSVIREATKFARALAQCGTYYLCEAFGALHRHDISLTVVPRLFQPSKRALGPLVHQELTQLCSLATDSVRPRAFMLGGGKPQTKIPLMHGLLPIADAFFLLPALDFTVLKANGQSVGASLVADNVIPDVRALTEAARSTHTLIHLPSDYLVLDRTRQNRLAVIPRDAFTPTMVGISIGPKTIIDYNLLLSQYKTLFINGIPGLETVPESLKPGIELLTKAATKLNVNLIAGGGDTVALIEEHSLTQDFDFLSTGGGAALAVLAQEPLPALEVLLTPT